MGSTVDFANTIRNMRVEKGLSQQQLANKLFVSRASVANWENCRRVPDAILMSRLAGVFGVDVSTLLSVAEMKDTPPNVIIVDDEELLLVGAIPTLSEAMPGAEITGFSIAEEAIEFARGNRISIAFLDIELGRGINGFELYEALIEINPLTNVVFLTGYPDYSLKAWKTYASGFLVKPLELEDVMEQLKKLRHPVKGLTLQ